LAAIFMVDILPINDPNFLAKTLTNGRHYLLECLHLPSLASRLQSRSLAKSEMFPLKQ